MRTHSIILTAVIVCLISSCTGGKRPYDMIRPGMTRSEIVSAIGTTDIKRFITKTNNQIQGAEEEFWYDLDFGTKLEVWTYKYDRGTLNLYFIGQSNDLKYKIFTNK